MIKKRIFPEKNISSKQSFPLGGLKKKFLDRTTSKIVSKERVIWLKYWNRCWNENGDKQNSVSDCVLQTLQVTIRECLAD